MQAIFKTCPQCQSKLLIKQEVAHCPKYHGVLLTLVAFRRSTSQVFVQKCWQKWLQLTNKKSFKCPSCLTRMINLNYDSQHSLQLDCCPSCYAIWLDSGELSIIKDLFKSSEDGNSKRWDEFAQSLLMHQKTIDRYQNIQKYGNVLGQDAGVHRRVLDLFKLIQKKF